MVGCAADALMLQPFLCLENEHLCVVTVLSCIVWLCVVVVGKEVVAPLGCCAQSNKTSCVLSRLQVVVVLVDIQFIYSYMYNSSKLQGHAGYCRVVIQSTTRP